MSPAPLAFERLLHADWSVASGKRWIAEAKRTPAGWFVRAPQPAGAIDAFRNDLLSTPHTLAGFDFPIGMPAAYGRQTGFTSFPDALVAIGAGPWCRFFDVCDTPEEIALTRPFYPRVSSSRASQAHLLRGLGVDTMLALYRGCERRTCTRPAASPLFWTIGAKQVGKAAIAGWRDVVQPARRNGARLWPFDGDLAALSQGRSAVLCETYPAEAYRHVGLRFARGASERRQHDRRQATAALEAHCRDRGIALAADLSRQIADGFGSRGDSEDAFDAVAGLLGMIEVAEGRRAAKPPTTSDPAWEGWILGQLD